MFTNRGGAIEELRTGRFVSSVDLTAEERLDPANWVELLGAQGEASFLLRPSPSARDLAGDDLASAFWTMRVLGSEDAPEGVEFAYAPGNGVRFTKRFLSVPGRFGLRFELEIANLGFTGQPGPRQLVLTPVGWLPADSGDPWYPEPRALAAAQTRGNELPEPRIERVHPAGGEPTGPLVAQGPLAYAGVDTKYFAVLVAPDGENAQASMLSANWRRLRDDAWAKAHPEKADEAWRQVVADVDLQVALPPAGESRAWSYAAYAGPKDRELLGAASPHYPRVVEHDLDVWFLGSGISQVMLAVLGFFHRITTNWGVAIILLTLSVRLMLFPVNRRSQTAMARYQTKMKRLQPRLDELKKRYEKDPAKLRQEQAKMMQQEGAFPPLGGCLPVFVQIPVFFGLYRALGISFDLRQQPFFGWIHDLSLPDRLMPLGLDTHLPLIGTIGYLNVLPPLMVVLWIWQQRGMPTPADEQAARMQKMMMWMPVMMGFFLYNYAAGLSLYMITTSGLAVFEQKVIKKYWPVDDSEKPAKKGFLGRLMEKQQEQMRRIQEGHPGGRRARRDQDPKSEGPAVGRRGRF